MTQLHSGSLNWGFSRSYVSGKMKMKWLTITVCWGATTFPKGGVEEHGEKAQHSGGLCHPEHAACVHWGCVCESPAPLLYSPSLPAPRQGKCKHAYARPGWWQRAGSQSTDNCWAFTAKLLPASALSTSWISSLEQAWWGPVGKGARSTDGAPDSAGGTRAEGFPKSVA